MRNQGESESIDYPWKTARTFPPPTSRIPPFLQYIYEKNKSKYFDGEKLTINKSIPEVIRDNFEDLELKSYGVIGKNWAKIFKINNHSTEYRKKTVPILSTFLKLRYGFWAQCL